MLNTLKFKKRSDLLSYLINQLKFSSYNLEKGLDLFESKILATSGFSKSDEVSWEVFDWKDENANDISVEIAFISNPLDEECTEFEDYYLILCGKVIPPLVGLKEFAEIIGWNKARLSTKYSRQREGKKVRPPIPEPIQILASTPIWTLKQAQEYKKLID